MKQPEQTRVLFVGRGRLTVPLAPWLAKKWDALEEELEVRVLNAGTGSGDPRFRLLPDSARAFYLGLPRAVARELADFRPDCGRRGRLVRRRGGARGPSPRSSEDQGDRRGARRPGDLHAPLRLVVAQATCAVRRRGEPHGAPPLRRDPRGVGVHGSHRRALSRPAADRLLHRVQRSLGLRRSSARAGSRRSPASSSSGRSSATRTSTGWPTHGGWWRASCRTQG